jgi:hypothetical protein
MSEPQHRGCQGKAWHIGEPREWLSALCHALPISLFVLGLFYYWFGGLAASDLPAACVVARLAGVCCAPDCGDPTYHDDLQLAHIAALPCPCLHRGHTAGTGAGHVARFTGRPTP